MKPFSITIKEPLTKGLVLKDNPRNQPGLVESIGAFPYNNALQSTPSLTAIDTTSLGALAYPYPQQFVSSNFIVVCTPTAIYEYTGASLVLKISGLTQGTPWDAEWWKDYAIFSNMKVTVVRNPDDTVYSISTTLPTFSAIYDYNGQAIIGSVNQSAVGTI